MKRQHNQLMKAARMETETQMSRCTELKHSPTAYAGTLNVVGDFFDATSIPQGSGGQFVRVGSEITLKSVHYRLSLQSTATSQADAGLARIIVFQWHMDSTNVAPALIDILEGPSILQVIDDFYNQEGSQRYTIIDDRVVNFGMAGPETVFVCFSDQANHIDPKYTGSLGGTNHIYVVVAGIGSASYEVTTNVYYTDS